MERQELHPGIFVAATPGGGDSRGRRTSLAKRPRAHEDYEGGGSGPESWFGFWEGTCGAGNRLADRRLHVAAIRNLCRPKGGAGDDREASELSPRACRCAQ